MKIDDQTPEGLRLLYDLLVKASEYPGESSHNPKNLYLWGEKLRSLHQLLSGYHDEEYLKEYRHIQKMMEEVSKSYPTDEYVRDGYDVLYEWLGSIGRLYGRLGLMIPQNLVYTEGGDEGV
ncbi:hypothetical protein [Caldiplasma sukawensis]